jgi:hypothetical protein
MSGGEPSLNGILSDIYFDDKSSLPETYKSQSSDIGEHTENPPDSTGEDIDDETDLNSIIDTGWIDTFSRLHNINENQSREPMTSIGIYFVYINKNSYIENISFEKQSLVPGGEFSILPKETVLKLIQSKKVSTPVSKYKLSDILSFVVDIEPEHIQDYIQREIDFEDSKRFLKVLPIFNDIRIDKSIFIFHNTNYLYFIFQEYEFNSSYTRSTLKSILKSNATRSEVSGKGTKKVRIALTPREHSSSRSRRRFTRKNVS